MKDKKKNRPVNETLRKVFETISGAPVADGEKEPECTITNEDTAPKAKKGIGEYFETVLLAVLIIGSVIIPACMVIGVCINAGSELYYYISDSATSNLTFFGTLIHSAKLLGMSFFGIIEICILSVAIALVVFIGKSIQQLCKFVYYSLSVYFGKRKLVKNYSEIAGKLRTLDERDAKAGKTENKQDPTVVNSSKAKKILYDRGFRIKKEVKTETVPPVESHVVKSTDLP